MKKLEELKAECDLLDWEDSDLMPISVVGNLGTLRKLIAVAEAARAHAKVEDVRQACDRSEHAGWYYDDGQHCPDCNGYEPRDRLISRKPNAVMEALAALGAE